MGTKAMPIADRRLDDMSHLAALPDRGKVIVTLPQITERLVQNLTGINITIGPDDSGDGAGKTGTLVTPILGKIINKVITNNPLGTNEPRQEGATKMEFSMLEIRIYFRLELTKQGQVIVQGLRIGGIPSSQQNSVIPNLERIPQVTIKGEQLLLIKFGKDRGDADRNPLVIFGQGDQRVKSGGSVGMGTLATPDQVMGFGKAVQ